MASFENIPVTLKGFEMEDASMLWSVFIAQIGRNVKVGCTVSSRAPSMLLPQKRMIKGWIRMIAGCKEMKQRPTPS